MWCPSTYGYGALKYLLILILILIHADTHVGYTHIRQHGSGAVCVEMVFMVVLLKYKQKVALLPFRVTKSPSVVHYAGTLRASESEDRSLVKAARSCAET